MAANPPSGQVGIHLARGAPTPRATRTPPPRALKGEAAVGEMDLPCRVGAFVGAKIDGEHRDLPRRPQATHRLTIDEGLPDRIERLTRIFGERRDALVERRALDRTRTDRIAADAAL